MNLRHTLKGWALLQARSVTALPVGASLQACCCVQTLDCGRALSLSILVEASCKHARIPQTSLHRDAAAWYRAPSLGISPCSCCIQAPLPSLLWEPRPAPLSEPCTGHVTDMMSAPAAPHAHRAALAAVAAACAALPHAAAQDSPPDSSSSSDSDGAAAGSAVGAVTLVIIVLVTCCCCIGGGILACWSQKKHMQSKRERPAAARRRRRGCECCTAAAAGTANAWGATARVYWAAVRLRGAAIRAWLPGSPTRVPVVPRIIHKLSYL